MFNQIPRNEDLKTVVQAAMGLSPDQSILLRDFLQGKPKPAGWPADYWLYLKSGQAAFVELANILELRLAFGDPFLKAVRISDEELIEGLSAWLILDAMTDIARKLFR